MKNTKNTVLKAVLLITLICPVAFADGEMGSGGKTCPEGQTCLTGEMGSGGLAGEPSIDKNSTASNPEGYLEWMVEYFDWLF